MDRETIADELRTGTHYTYDDGPIEVDCVPDDYGHSAVIGHFQIEDGSQGQGLGSTVMDILLDVLRDDGFDIVSARIAVTHEPTLSDPTVEFLQSFGFTFDRFEDDPDWGDVVHAHKELDDA